MGKMISKYVSEKEAYGSETAIKHGISNSATEVQRKNVVRTAKMFDVIREHFGCPISIHSFFRCQKLNKLVGGSKTSQHTKGEALDLSARRYGGTTNREVFEFVKEYINFDQMIYEKPNEKGEASWIHISYKHKGNRREVLVYTNEGKYIPYSTWARKH